MSRVVKGRLSRLLSSNRGSLSRIILVSTNQIPGFYEFGTTGPQWKMGATNQNCWRYWRGLEGGSAQKHKEARKLHSGFASHLFNEPSIRYLLKQHVWTRKRRQSPRQGQEPLRTRRTAVPRRPRPPSSPLWKLRRARRCRRPGLPGGRHGVPRGRDPRAGRQRRS